MTSPIVPVATITIIARTASDEHLEHMPATSMAWVGLPHAFADAAATPRLTESPALALGLDLTCNVCRICTCYAATTFGFQVLVSVTPLARAYALV